MTMQPDATADIGDAFRKAMRRIASTVSIITASNQGQRYGITVTSVTSVSMNPPSLLTCINQKTTLHRLLLVSDVFCVNVLHRDHVDLSHAFAGSVPHEQRFASGDWSDDADGIPYLKDAQANLFCRRKAFVSYGTHTIFIGEVEKVAMREAIAPLVYLDAVYSVAGKLGPI